MNKFRDFFIGCHYFLIKLFVDNIWKQISCKNEKITWLNMGRKYSQSVEIYYLNY